MSVDIKDLKKGEVIYSFAGRHIYEIEVLTNPEFKLNDAYRQWSFIGKTCDGECYFMETEGLEHYGPKLSRQIEYAGDVYRVDGTIDSQKLF